jgi:hypothetical protein
MISAIRSAARAAAYRAQKDQAVQPNPRIMQTFAADADCYRLLGAKFDAARRTAAQQFGY